MKRSHCELGSRFADSLRGDNPNRLAQFDRRIRAQIIPVAKLANSSHGLTSNRRTEQHARNVQRRDFFCVRHSKKMALFNDNLFRFRIDNIARQDTSEYPKCEIFTQLFVIFSEYLESGFVFAVRLRYDHVLNDINQAPG